MSVELLYTSAPSGLRQGSRGFCTVISTTGMPINLATKLESLSGYRHVFPPQDANAESNPVCHSHLKVKVAGKSSSVLSRIAAFGVDYSGRTNKLAHHVIVEPHEQAPAGPSWLLGQPSIMRSTWDGKNATPPVGPTIGQSDQGPRVCSGWKSIMGDAGWGGVVADALASAATTKPTWIIFDVTQSDNLLNLIDESIALLDPSRRWSATFSTYFTNLPPEIDCQVRCVIVGSDEARLAAARGTVIDLTKPAPVAGRSPLIELARSGKSVANPVVSTPVVAAPAIPAARPLPMSREPAPAFAPTSQGLVLDEDFADEPEIQISPPTHRSVPASAISPKRPIGPPPTPSKPERSPVIMAVVVVAAVLMLGGAALVYLKRTTDQATAQIKDMTSFGSARAETKKPVGPKPDNNPANTKDEAADSIRRFEKKLGEINSQIPKKPAELSRLPKVGEVQLDREMNRDGLRSIDAALEWAKANREKQDADAVKALKEIPAVEITLDEIANSLGGEESTDTQSIRGVKNANDARLKLATQFNAEANTHNDKLAQLSQQLNELSQSIHSDSKASKVPQQVRWLQNSIVDAVHQCEQAKVTLIEGKLIERLNGAVAKLDDQIEKLNQWSAAFKTVERVKTELIDRSRKFTQAQASTEREKRTLTVKVVKDKKQRKVDTESVYKLPVSGIGDATAYRWIKPDEDVESSATGNADLKRDTGNPSIVFKDPAYDLFSLNVNRSDATLELRYTVVTKKTKTTDTVLDKNAIALLESLGAGEKLQPLIAGWQPMSEMTADKDKPDDPVREFNRVRAEAQRLASELNWKTCDHRSLDLLQSLIKVLIKMNSPTFAGEKPSCEQRIEELTELQKIIGDVVKHRNFVNGPNEMPELRLALFVADDSSAGALKRPAKLLDVVTIQPIVVLDLEASE